MQILMGPHQTLVRIDETKTSAGPLFTFITHHFTTYQIHHNHLLLAYAPEDHYKHVFLLKWLYSIHKKSHKKELLELKNVLVNRIEKPLKLILKHPIDTRIPVLLSIYPDKRVRFKLTQPHSHLIDHLSRSLAHRSFRFTSDRGWFDLFIDSDQTKALFEKLLADSCIGDLEIRFEYNKTQMGEFLKSLSWSDPLILALQSLQSAPEDDLSVIQKRYKKLLAAYHPDNVYTQGEGKIQEYTHIFQNLQYSFEVVKKSYQMA